MRDRVTLHAPPVGATLVATGRDPGGPGATVAALLERERERAFAAGVEEGRRAEHAEAAGRLDAAVEGLALERAAVEEELARTAIELAASIARTLVRSELRHGGHDVEALVRETLAEANTGRAPCVVHLNPLDCARLADARFRTGTVLQADEGVAVGDVHVETSLGLLVREALGAIEAIERRLVEELA